jgi:hypothetical protein
MTRGSILEYIRAIKERYIRGARNTKGKILDEFVSNTGYHRKSAVRVLNKKNPGNRIGKRGRPTKYKSMVASELKYLWEITDHLCSKRLHPFIPELLDVLKRNGNHVISQEIEMQLRTLSPSTMDRLLRTCHQKGGRSRFSTTKPGTLLKNAIPIKTFTDWTENSPGFFEADTVAHCGDSIEGFCLYTLSTVDVATGWIECVGTWGKGQTRIRQGIHRIRQRLPFHMLGLDSDNGSEFINQHLLNYCRQWNITFTRSRSYKKNDSCHVEQKNWNVVRRVVGYGRYSSRASLAALNDVYSYLRLYMNFFQPVMKIVSKTRHGARVHKIYDTAQTPYQRLLKYDMLSEDKRRELHAIYQSLDPITLIEKLNRCLEQLWEQEENKVQPKRYGIHKI